MDRNSVCYLNSGCLPIDTDRNSGYVYCVWFILSILYKCSTNGQQSRNQGRSQTCIEIGTVRLVQRIDIFGVRGKSTCSKFITQISQVNRGQRPWHCHCHWQRPIYDNATRHSRMSAQSSRCRYVVYINEYYRYFCSWRALQKQSSPEAEVVQPYSTM